MKNKTKIRDINSENEDIYLLQKKAAVWEIEELTAYQDEEDPISCEIGVAKLSCGHKIGREALRCKINKHLKDFHSDFNCPKPECLKTITDQ